MKMPGAVVMVGAVVLAACPGDRDRPAEMTDTVPRAREAIAPEARVHLDSGNAAYREQRYPEALGHFEAAARLDSLAAPAWFGVYMAHTALGDAPAAERAMARARQVAPGGALLERLRDDEPGVIPIAPIEPTPDTGVDGRPGGTPR